MKRIIWDDRFGLALPEGRIEEEMPKLVAKLEADGELSIGQSVLFDALRREIKRGNLKDCCVVHHGVEARITHKGHVIRWPHGLADLQERIIMELIL